MAPEELEDHNHSHEGHSHNHEIFHHCLKTGRYSTQSLLVVMVSSLCEFGVLTWIVYHYRSKMKGLNFLLVTTMIVNSLVKVTISTLLMAEKMPQQYYSLIHILCHQITKLFYMLFMIRLTKVLIYMRAA